MVKKPEYSPNIFNELLRITASEGIHLRDKLTEVLDILVKETQADFAYLSDRARVDLHLSSNVDLETINHEDISGNDDDLTDIYLCKPISNWGNLLVREPKNKGDKQFWDFVVNLLSMALSNESQRERTDLLVSLSSDIRKTLKPDIAMEKIYKGLNPFFNLQECYFFAANPEGQGFGLAMSKREDGLDPKLPNSVEKDFIEELSFVESGLETLVFECKSRERIWGILIFARKETWSEEDKLLVRPFIEQLALVFNQHELHEESLSMAQREFLLNQITTTIRESLELDTIIQIAAQEIAQVLGVEACGVTLLDNNMRTTLNHAVWTSSDDMHKKMTALIKRSINSEYAPTLENPLVSLSSFAGRDDSLASFFSDILGVKSYMACALRRHDNDALIGILSVAFINQNRDWTESEEQLLESIGTQLEMALTQAAIYQESQQTKMQMDLLHKLSNDIRESLDISDVLEKIAKGLGEVLSLSRCFVRRFTRDYRILKTEKEYTAEGIFPSADIIFDFEEEWIRKLSKGNIGKEGYQYLNIPYVKAKMMAKNSQLLGVAEAIELKSYLCVPLIARDRILGTINVHQCDRERNFLPEEIEFVCRVASEAAVAIEHAQLFATIDFMSKTDPDTGLLNKRFFNELAEEEIEESKVEGRDVSFILLDLDFLKEINDTPDIGGHEAGDEAIMLVSRALEKTVRQAPADEIRTRRADIVARFGGDEFMILLPSTDIEDAVLVSERILANIQRSEHTTWQKQLSASIGVAGTPYDKCEFQWLKTRADNALYLAKKKGRGQICSSVDLDKQ